MYLKRIEKCLKIMKEIGNLLTEDQIGNWWIKETSNVLIVKKRATLNQSVEPNQGIERTIEILGS